MIAAARVDRRGTNDPRLQTRRAPAIFLLLPPRPWGLVVLGLTWWGWLWYKSARLADVREVDIDIVFDGPGTTKRALFFPAGSQPELLRITLRNEGPGALVAPQLVINEQNPFASQEEMIEHCRTYGDSTAVLLCLSNLLSDNLGHVETASLGWENANFPRSALEALNYYGYSQCGPSSDFLMDFAHRLGFKACTLAFRRHVVAEIDVDGGPILIDADRRLFYTTDTYDRLLGYAEIRKGRAFHNTIGRSAPVDALLAFESRLSLIEDAERYCDPKPAPDFPLATWEWPAGTRLAFTRECESDNLGCLVTWEGARTIFGWEKFNLPYPGLFLKFDPPAGVSLIHGRLAEPTGESFVIAGGTTSLDLSGKTDRFSRIFEVRAHFENKDPHDVPFRFLMRYARASIPDLHEGINTFRLYGRTADDAIPRIAVRLRVRTRIDKSLDRPDVTP
ncbi:MAG: hypothetical protein M5R36_26970 [Deltaproteobacteria bacterium]|nr:hypothetical protein [Deltaproteobacteria bacterium]